MRVPEGGRVRPQSACSDPKLQQGKVTWERHSFSVENCIVRKTAQQREQQPGVPEQNPTADY